MIRFMARCLAYIVIFSVAASVVALAPSAVKMSVLGAVSLIVLADSIAWFRRSLWSDGITPIEKEKRP